MFTKYLPTFKAVEINTSTGLRCGQVLSQFKANAAIHTVTKGDSKFIENGIICGLDADGSIANYDKAKHDTLLLHFTEEINEILPGLKYFAVPVDGDTYPRCIGLFVGDSFTTNNYSGTVEGAKFAKVVGGVLTLQTAADADSAFIVVETTMPDGEEGCEFTYYRKPAATASV